MKSKHSPNPHRAENPAWLIGAGTRQGAREADACIVPDDWLYAAPSLPRQGEPQANGFTAPTRTPAR